MNARVALLSIIVEGNSAVDALNALLNEYRSIVVGRMGIPYRKRNINIISVAVDAEQDVIAALAGKIGNLAGITVKTVYSKTE